MKCVYVRTNLINGKQYVGQTTDFENREETWRYSNDYAGSLINRAREKYGYDNWSVKVLVECDTQDELNKWESYFIKELNTFKPNGYNLTYGGDGCSGFKHSEETKKKISDAHKGKNTGQRPDWVRRKISEGHKGQKPTYGHLGKKHSEETKRLLSDINKGKPGKFKGKHHSEESKKKMSDAHKGKKLSEETKRKMSEAHKKKSTG